MGVEDEKLQILIGRQLSWEVHRKAVIRSLAEVEFSVFSQWGMTVSSSG